MKLFVLIAVLGLPVPAFCQDEEVWKPASAKSEAYHEQRHKNTIPPYGLAKVKKLIEGIRTEDADYDAKSEITYQQWQALSLREKFTYCMIHGDRFTQNCDVRAPIQDEDQKIFAHLLSPFEEEFLSDRQRNWLSVNKDSVLALMGESIGRTGYVGLNYKTVIVDLNGTSMIPQLIAVYSKTKADKDILTVLNLLMKKNEFKPFMESGSYKKLYESSDAYMAHINYNQANEELIIKRATEFHQSLKK